VTVTQANLKISQQIWLASGSNKNLTVVDQAQRAWQLLTDFQNWQKWQPKILSASRTDGDGPGRGSTILVVSGNSRNPSNKTWKISYWEPPQRVDFIVQSPKMRVAYSLRLEPESAAATLALLLEVEIELEGIRKLLKPVYLWCYRRKSAQLLSAFARYWSESKG